jgi:tRNA(Ile)-lysidine synthase TilS/MesJ
MVSILFHYPNKSHIRFKIHKKITFHSVIQIIKQHKQLNPTIHDTLSLTTLLDRYVVFVDGLRLYALTKDTPINHSCLILASNKILLSSIADICEIISLQQPVKKDMPSYGCHICLQKNAIPIYYNHANQKRYCETCFRAWFENKCFNVFDMVEFKESSSYGISISGERDSVTVCHILRTYLQHHNLPQNIRLVFLENGNEGDSRYRENSWRFLKSFSQQLKSETTLIKRSIHNNSAVNITLDTIGQFMKTVNCSDPDAMDICMFCEWLYDNCQSKSIDKPPAQFVIAGNTASDEFRHLPFIKQIRFVTREAGRVYVYPLKHFTDEEVLVYTGIARIDYYVDDCSYREFSSIYAANQERQVIDAVLPGWAKQQIAKLYYSEIVRLASVFAQIYSLWNPNFKIHDRRDVLQRCNKCHKSMFSHNGLGIQEIVTSSHNLCRQSSFPPEKQHEYNKFLNTLIEQSGLRYLEYDITEHEEQYFRLSSTTNVKFVDGDDSYAIVFRSNDRQAMRLPIIAGWERDLIADLYRGWVSSTEILTKYRDDYQVPEAHIEQFLMLWDRKLLEVTEAIPSADLSPKDEKPKICVITDNAHELSNLPFGIISFTNAIPSEDKFQEIGVIIVLATSIDFHRRILTKIFYKGKPIIHAGVNNKQLIVGPVSHLHRRGCLECFSAHLEHSQFSQQSFDLWQEQPLTSDELQLLWALIKLKLKLLVQSSTHQLVVNVYDFIQDITRKVTFPINGDCSICQPKMTRKS